MSCWWWSQLPLLIIIQLLEPSRSNQNVYAEALHAFKCVVGDPQQLSNWVGRHPYLRPGTGASYADRSKYPASFPLSPTFSLCPQKELISSSPSALTSSPSLDLIPLHVHFYKSRKTRVTAAVGGNIGISTVSPSQDAYAKKSGKPKIVAIVVGCVGAALLVIVIVLLVYVCLMRAKRFIIRTSETSSVQTPPVELPRGNGSPLAEITSPSETGNLRQITFVELELATSSFSESNYIGEGGFGLVYKGLLQDGSIVAIKRRLHGPSQNFVREVESIGRMRHRHLVKLIGCCQENHQQLLVYDYLPNGNVGNHLYDSEGLPIGKLDIRQRLSFAVSAAKGLEYLHCLEPPFLHTHFRTSNVLLDEYFAAKVSDFGLSKLVMTANRAGSSLGIDCFLDPELSLSDEFSPRSDVYSFGVFLLELISGREALDRNQLDPLQNLVAQAKGIGSLENFVDEALREKAMTASMQRMMELALLCVGSSVRRPTMTMVVKELELIQVRETGHVSSDDPGEEISVVTLGSELFK